MDQFAPIFAEGEDKSGSSSSSSTAIAVAGRGAPHYGPRCLVRSRRDVAPRVLCREYVYLPGDPTAPAIATHGGDNGVPSLGARPQRPLRAAFQVATTAKVPWQEEGN